MTDVAGGKIKAKVQHSYTPEQSDELQLEIGDIIEVLKQEEEGWWEGNLNGVIGMFPSNFVEIIQDSADSPDKDDTKEAVKEIRPKKVQGVGLGNIFGSGPIKLRPTTGQTPGRLVEHTVDGHDVKEEKSSVNNDSGKGDDIVVKRDRNELYGTLTEGSYKKMKTYNSGTIDLFGDAGIDKSLNSCDSFRGKTLPVFCNLNSKSKCYSYPNISKSNRELNDNFVNLGLIYAQYSSLNNHDVGSFEEQQSRMDENVNNSDVQNSSLTKKLFTKFLPKRFSSFIRKKEKAWFAKKSRSKNTTQAIDCDVFEHTCGTDKGSNPANNTKKLAYVSGENLNFNSSITSGDASGNSNGGKDEGTDDTYLSSLYRNGKLSSHLKTTLRKYNLLDGDNFRNDAMRKSKFTPVFASDPILHFKDGTLDKNMNQSSNMSSIKNVKLFDGNSLTDYVDGILFSAVGNVDVQTNDERDVADAMDDLLKRVDESCNIGDRSRLLCGREVSVDACGDIRYDEAVKLYNVPCGSNASYKRKSSHPTATVKSDKSLNDTRHLRIPSATTSDQSVVKRIIRDFGEKMNKNESTNVDCMQDDVILYSDHLVGSFNTKLIDDGIDYDNIPSCCSSSTPLKGNFRENLEVNIVNSCSNDECLARNGIKQVNESISFADLHKIYDDIARQQFDYILQNMAPFNKFFVESNDASTQVQVSDILLFETSLDQHETTLVNYLDKIPQPGCSKESIDAPSFELLHSDGWTKDSIRFSSNPGKINIVGKFLSALQGSKVDNNEVRVWNLLNKTIKHFQLVVNKMHKVERKAHKGTNGNVRASVMLSQQSRLLRFESMKFKKYIDDLYDKFLSFYCVASPSTGNKNLSQNGKTSPVNTDGISQISDFEGSSLYPWMDTLDTYTIDISPNKFVQTSSEGNFVIPKAETSLLSASSINPEVSGDNDNKDSDNDEESSLLSSESEQHCNEHDVTNQQDNCPKRKSNFIKRIFNSFWQPRTKTKLVSSNTINQFNKSHVSAAGEYDHIGFRTTKPRELEHEPWMMLDSGSRNRRRLPRVAREHRRPSAELTDGSSLQDDSSATSLIGFSCDTSEKNVAKYYNYPSRGRHSGDKTKDPPTTSNFSKFVDETSDDDSLDASSVRKKKTSNIQVHRDSGARLNSPTFLTKTTVIWSDDSDDDDNDNANNCSSEVCSYLNSSFYSKDLKT